MVPQETSLLLQTFTVMKVDLNVSAASKVVSMSGCSKASEYGCGIAWRNG